MMDSLGRVLLNPLFLLVVLIAAIGVGLVSPDLSMMLEPLGGYYLSLLKMVVLPYLFVTITAGVARMVSDPRAAVYVHRMLVVYPFAMVLAGAVALACSLILPPGGGIDAQTMSALGGIVSGQEDGGAMNVDIALEPSAAEPVTGESPFAFLDRFVPENIFAALSSGDSLKTVIFCMIFGVALARVSRGETSSWLETFLDVQAASLRVIRWINMLLPFALFGMVSAQVASVGVGPLLSLGRFIEVQALAGAILMALSVAVISYRARVSPFAAISRLGDTIILAISTRSSMTCIPIASREMTEGLRFDRQGIDLVLPLGITLCRLASVAYLLIGGIFIAQVYGVDLGAHEYLTLFMAALVAGLAASGATGPMAVMLVSLVVGPLDLPAEAAIVLFIAIDPILDVIRTVVLVYGNCALAALMVPQAAEEAAGAVTGGMEVPVERAG